MMADVPALCLGAWRLQSTTALCFPACGWQFLRLPAGEPQIHLVVFVCVIVFRLYLQFNQGSSPWRSAVTIHHDLQT